MKGEGRSWLQLEVHEDLKNFAGLDTSIFFGRKHGSVGSWLHCKDDGKVNGSFYEIGEHPTHKRQKKTSCHVLSDGN